MGDYIALGIIVILVVGALVYLVRQKKKGVKCIGCPHSANCGAKNQGCGCTKNDH